MIIGLTCACRRRVELVLDQHSVTGRSPARLRATFRWWRTPDGRMLSGPVVMCQCGRRYRAVDGEAPGIERIT